MRTQKIQVTDTPREHVARIPNPKSAIDPIGVALILETGWKLSRTGSKLDTATSATMGEPVEDVMTFMPLGSGQEVGRSCHLLSFRGRNIILDCRQPAHVWESQRNSCARDAARRRCDHTVAGRRASPKQPTWRVRF